MIKAWQREWNKDQLRAIAWEREACAQIVDHAPQGSFMDETAKLIRARE